MGEKFKCCKGCAYAGRYPGTQKELCCNISLYARPALQLFGDKVIDTRGTDPKHCLRRKAGKHKMLSTGFGWKAIED